MHERLFRSLYRIRRVEEEIARVYPSDKIKSPVHLSIGQEAVSVGVAEALHPHDIVFGTYRGHALYLAKGGNLNKMIAELYGKATGCCRGKGGSMHLADVDHGFMGTSAVVATTIPTAVGYAYSLKYRHSNNIVATFFGDGAVEEGVFHESLNFAALKKLPILFVCENNKYAIHSHQTRRQARDNICERAAIYGIHTEQFEDDVIALYKRASEIIQVMRTGACGPFFIECMTYRWKEHVGPNEDFNLGYRDQDESAKWIENDQVRRLALMLGPELRKKIESEVDSEISEAFNFAEQSPFPGEEELFSDLFQKD